jgi:hypothetical protein
MTSLYALNLHRLASEEDFEPSILHTFDWFVLDLCLNESQFEKCVDQSLRSNNTDVQSSFESHFTILNHRFLLKKPVVSNIEGTGSRLWECGLVLIKFFEVSKSIIISMCLYLQGLIIDSKI